MVVLVGLFELLHVPQFSEFRKRSPNGISALGGVSGKVAGSNLPVIRMGQEKGKDATCSEGKPFVVQSTVRHCCVTGGSLHPKDAHVIVFSCSYA